MWCGWTDRASRKFTGNSPSRHAMSSDSVRNSGFFALVNIPIGTLIICEMHVKILVGVVTEILAESKKWSICSNRMPSGAAWAINRCVQLSSIRRPYFQLRHAVLASSPPTYRPPGAKRQIQKTGLVGHSLASVDTSPNYSTDRSWPNAGLSALSPPKAFCARAIRRVEKMVASGLRSPQN